MIDFMRFKNLYFLISGVILVPGIISLLLFGLKPSIDFTGGTLLELKLEDNDQFSIFIDSENRRLRTFQTIDDKIISVQKSGEETYLLKMEPVGEEEKNKIKNKLAEKFGQIEEIRFETVGPTLGRELLRKTFVAIILASGFILAYIAYRFRDKMYGICAVLAMFHDTLILLGSFSLLGHFLGVEVDTLFVTAVLTTLSSSVHDTVVTYDSIRNAIKQSPKTPLVELINIAINRTLIRNLNNSLTIIFMLLALVLLGGSTIRWFAVALLIGTCAGTYSSTFIATPLLLVWKRLEEKARSKFRR